MQPMPGRQSPPLKRSAVSVPERLFAWYLADPRQSVLIGEIGRVSNGDASLTYTPTWRQTGFALSEAVKDTIRQHQPTY